MEFWSFQASRTGSPMEWQGKEDCWLLGERAGSSNTWPVFCQNYQPDMMLARIRILEEKAISGLKEAPRDLLRVITMHLFPTSECRKSEWEDDWTGFVVLAELALESEMPKMQSRHLAEDWRCDLEMEQFIRVKLKIEVSMLYKGQDEDILIKLTVSKREYATDNNQRNFSERGMAEELPELYNFSNFFLWKHMNLVSNMKKILSQ